MTPTLIDGKSCAYDNCFQPVEATDVRWFHSDPGPHTCYVFYHCLMGHRWMEEATE